VEAVWTSETLVSRHITSPWRWKQRGPPKRWYPSTSTFHPEDGGSMILRICFLSHQNFILNMEAARSSEMLVSYHMTSPWRWRQHDPPKRLYPTKSARHPEDGGGIARRIVVILPHHFTLNLEAAWSSEMLYSITSLHRVTTLETLTWRR